MTTVASAPLDSVRINAAAVESERVRSASSIGGLLFSLSMVTGIVYFLAAPLAGIGPGPESLNLARSLAANGTFADPYHASPSGFSAHMAPLYPLFMAGLLRLFANTTIFAVLMVAWNIFAQAIMVGLLPSLSGILFGRTTPGIFASALFILMPLNLLWPHWDAITVSCGLAVFCLMTRRIAIAPLRTDIVAGGAAGILMLFNPTMVIPCVAWVAYSVRGAARSRVVRLILAGGAAVVFVCIPWTVRNYSRFHTLVPLRDNFGMELHVSNRDGAGPTYIENLMRNPNMPHPNSNVEEARLVRKLGEVEYNRSRQALAVEWIRQHPREFVLLTIQRVERFWFPVAGSLPLSSWSTWMVTVLSMVGFAMLLVQRSPALWFLVPVMTLFPLPYYLVNNDARLRYPILWLSALCAGYALTAVLAKFRSRTD